MNPQSKKARIILVAAAVVVVFFLVDWYVSSEKKVVTPTPTVPTNSTSTPGGIDVEDIIKQGGAVEVEEIDRSAPNLDRKVVFSSKSQISPEAQSIIVTNVKKLQDLLKKNPQDFNTWNNLGVYYKSAEDYAAAVEVWTYVGRVFPTNYVSFGNLGFVYGYYLKDLVKAEQNYLQAIKNGPFQIYVYVQAVEFYRDVMKDTTKALKIAEEGYAKIPTSIDLENLVKALKQ